jgi:hypothetical protein
MTTTTTRGAILIAAALIAAGCGAANSGTAGHPAASSASARAHAEATSSGGQAAKKQAAALADACRPAGGWNDMYPGVPGAKAARKAFIKCEKIPRTKVFAWGVCLGKAYSHAPKGGAPGTPPEDARQSFLAAAFGVCTKAARGAA